MPLQNADVVARMFRDVLIVNTTIYPDPRVAEAEWAQRLGCVKPHYNVAAAKPGFDASSFGGVWTREDEALFQSRGVVLLKVQTQGHA